MCEKWNMQFCLQLLLVTASTVVNSEGKLQEVRIYHTRKVTGLGCCLFPLMWNLSQILCLRTVVAPPKYIQCICLVEI